MSENGIITYNGRDYLLCVMTGAYYNDRNEANLGELVRAVFALRGSLAPEAYTPPAAEDGQSQDGQAA